MVAVSQKINLNVDPTVTKACSRTPLNTKSTLNFIVCQNKTLTTSEKN
jgi:hypothetical protein